MEDVERDAALSHREGQPQEDAKPADGNDVVERGSRKDKVRYALRGAVTALKRNPAMRGRSSTGCRGAAGHIRRERGTIDRDRGKGKGGLAHRNTAGERKAFRVTPHITSPPPCAPALHPSLEPSRPRGFWQEAMVLCSRLQLAAPTGRSPFAALPFPFLQ